MIAGSAPKAARIDRFCIESTITAGPPRAGRSGPCSGASTTTRPDSTYDRVRGTLEYPFTMRALTEPVPGPTWAALFADAWPGYRRWYLDGAGPDRPDLGTAVRMLARHM